MIFCLTSDFFSINILQLCSIQYCTRYNLNEKFRKGNRINFKSKIRGKKLLCIYGGMVVKNELLGKA